MSNKIKSRKEVILTKWNIDTDNLICACLYKNPICSNYKNCEELEIIIRPYEDIESVCNNTRRKYKRIHNRLRQY